MTDKIFMAAATAESRKCVGIRRLSNPALAKKTGGLLARGTTNDFEKTRELMRARRNSYFHITSFMAGAMWALDFLKEDARNRGAK